MGGAIRQQDRREMLTARRALTIALIFGGAAAAAAIMAAWMSDPSFAQGNPFGAPRSAPQPADGIVGWILAKQSEFYRGLSASIRAAKVDGSAVWGLFGLSFAYGVFHAAGPGHGKAVISSYVVANGETWRRGVVLSFASALLQALVAVAVVGIVAVLLGATRRTMDGTVWWIEVVSYGLIALHTSQAKALIYSKVKQVGLVCLKIYRTWILSLPFSYFN